MKSATLPDQTLIAVPKTREQIQRDFDKYINQIRHSSRQWDLVSFAKDKYYTANDGTECRPAIVSHRHGFDFNFTPVYGAQETKKKRWNYYGK